MFTVCGLNYKTAPLHVREGFALPAAQHPAFLKRLHELKEINEDLNKDEAFVDEEDTVEENLDEFSQSQLSQNNDT